MNYKNIPYHHINYYWTQKLITLEQYKYLKQKYDMI